MRTDAYYRLNGDGFSVLKTSHSSRKSVTLLFSFIYQLKCSVLIHMSPSCVEYGIVLVPFLPVDDLLLAPGDSRPLIISGFIFPGVTFVLTGLMRWSLRLNVFMWIYVFIFAPFCHFHNLPL